MKIIEKKDRIDFLDERFYLIDEEKQIYYPSVTHVLDIIDKGFAFNQWLKDVGNNASIIAERAAESGSKIHNAIELLNLGEELTWSDKLFNLEEWRCILKYKEFIDFHQPTIIATEAIIKSDKFKYAGTVDIICELNNEVWLVDIKTGNALYDSHDLQISAYRSAWNENSDVKVSKQGILWLKALTRDIDKTGKKIQGKGWQLIESAETYENLFKVFKSALDIYYFKNPEPKPKNVTYPKSVKL